MNIFKSNHRYKLYNQGFHYIVEFATKHSVDGENYRKIFHALQEMYGPVRVDVDNGTTWPDYKLNDNWRTGYAEKQKRRRIYLKDPQVYTMALLRM